MVSSRTYLSSMLSSLRPAVELTADLAWPLPLDSRLGGWDRLGGIRVFHDFVWRACFPDERCQFRNGRALARMLKQASPPGKEPALLLTRRRDVTEGHV